MTEGRDPDAAEEDEPAPTEALDLGDPTEPVDVARPTTGAFARTTPPSNPIDLVSSTAANRLIAEPPPPREPTSGIDTLFGDDRFHDYEAPTGPPPRPAAPAPRPPASARPAPTEHHLTPLQRTLLAVTGGLLAAAALVGLFFVGTRLGAAADAEPSASRTARTPTPTPVPTVLPPGPVAVGTHRWDQLLGGECLGAWPGPWALSYRVVDCAAPHPAQLVARGRFPDPATPGYPGQAELQSRMSVLCSAPGVIDLAAAARYTDAQIQASYPATAAQWDAGDHWYYCFVTRSSGEPLTGSVAVAHDATPAP
ncbi:hypothetical protein [Pseudolysinimonas sp.]|uniref:hypothetical protein n=1 Tax=Pseudolysinimonas sp. TaxID=2680009 RepID=UPI003F805FCA